MKELNKHILLEAIENLPKYTPKDQIWDGIELALDKEQAETDFQETIAELPNYSPPDFVWNQIESTLDEEELMMDAGLEQETKVVRFNNWKKYASIAAAIALIISVAIPFLTDTKASDVSISYSEEVIQDELMNDDWDADEDAFQMVMAQCKEMLLACEQAEFKILKEELEELNMAREQLKEAMGGYNTDTNLLAQLTQIELERSDVLKKMIDRI